jgi:hypothetical protein
MYKLFAVAKARYHWMYGFRKCSSRDKIAPRESLHPCGYVPREKSRKTRVLGLPRTPKTEVVGHSSLSERHGSTNGPGTAQERRRLNGDALSAFPPPLRCAMSRSHAPFLSRSRTEERQKKPWRPHARRSVTFYISHQFLCHLLASANASCVSCVKIVLQRSSSQVPA